MTVGDSTPVSVARQWVRDHADDGVDCPVCTQLAKVYRRKIHAAMARDLIIARRVAGPDWFHVRTTLGHDGGDFAKLACWSLIVEYDAVRDDGGRAGWWRITDRGRAYVLDQLRVPKYARIYDGRLLNLTGDLVGVRDALGTRFRYDDLMAGI